LPALLFPLAGAARALAAPGRPLAAGAVLRVGGFPLAGAARALAAPGRPLGAGAVLRADGFPFAAGRALPLAAACRPAPLFAFVRAFRARALPFGPALTPVGREPSSL
jgi:hypothetical protein